MITVLMTAWPKSPERIDYMRRSCESMRNGLSGPIGKWIVSSETEGVTEDITAPEGWELWCRTGPAQLASHLNELLASLTGPVFYTQDDILLTEPLDLSGAVNVIHGGADMVRFRYERPEEFPPATQETFHQLPCDVKYLYSAFSVMFAPDFMRKYGKLPERRKHEHTMNRRLKKSKANVWIRLPIAVRHIGVNSLIRPGKVWKCSM